MLDSKQCEDCGKSIVSKRRFCDECRVNRHREVARRSARERYQPVEKPVRFCIVCGDKITHPRGSVICQKGECKKTKNARDQQKWATAHPEKARETGKAKSARYRMRHPEVQRMYQAQHPEIYRDGMRRYRHKLEKRNNQ